MQRATQSQTNVRRSRADYERGRFIGACWENPLTTAVERAASVLDYRSVIVVVTDGEETCGRSPCDLATQLHEAALRLY